MKDLSDFEKACEESFGLISGYMVFALWELSTAASSQWKYDEPGTIDIVVNKRNAADIYATCKEIRSGYSVGLSKDGMKKIKAARLEAHLFLVQEANDPNTSVERKIELVRLTSKGQ